MMNDIIHTYKSMDFLLKSMSFLLNFQINGLFEIPQKYKTEKKN